MQINDYAAFSFAYDGYKVNDQANNTGDANITYFGFVNKFGEWFIMRQTVSGTTLSFRFYKGASGYTTGWSARQTFTYDYLDVIFK